MTSTLSVIILTYNERPLFASQSGNRLGWVRENFVGGNLTESVAESTTGRH